MGGVLPSKRTIFEGSLLLTVVTLAAIFSGAAAVPTRDPDQMWECRPAPSQSLSFCSMIDYQYNVSYISQNGSAVWDHQSGNDSFARSVYDSFIRQLSVYNCLEYNRYWTCDNCSDAYKVWLCAVLFPKCTDQTPNQVNVSEWKAQGPTGGPTCPPRCTLEQEIEANKTGAAATDCTMLTLPWHRCVPQTRTCRGVCYDVVRKCPVHLGFKCPLETDHRDYTGLPWETSLDAVIRCNNINMTSSVEPPNVATITRLSHIVAAAAALAIVVLLL